MEYQDVATPIIALSENQRKNVWESWLHAEVLAHYFGELAARYQSRQKTLNWLILFFSSGAFVTIVSSDWLPSSLHWLRPVSALLTVAISLTSVVQENPRRATECSNLYARWARLASEFQELWDNMYSEAAREKLKELDDKATELSERGNVIPYKKQVMAKYQEYIERAHGPSAAR